MPTPSQPLDQMKAGIITALSSTTGLMRAHFNGLKDLESGALWLVLPELSREHVDTILRMLTTITISIVSFASNSSCYSVSVEFKEDAVSPVYPTDGFSFGSGYATVQFTIEPHGRWELLGEDVPRFVRGWIQLGGLAEVL